jgi:phosphoribosylformimino-5-aminoimidazole carboxamide ribotide isomerase
MRIIPVLDILDGEVVRGISGERNRYRPIESRITESIDPVQVARDILEYYPFPQIYIADLDRIEGKGDNTDQVQGIMNLGYEVYLDPGIGGAADISQELRDVQHLVVGTETLHSLGELSRICDSHASVVVSLDYKGEGLLTRHQVLRALEPAELVQKICRSGVSEVIYLDLSRVGTGSGVFSKRLAEVASSSTVPLLVGGGIRNSEDVEALEILEVSGVLVASSLHNKELNRDEIVRFAGPAGQS